MNATKNVVPRNRVPQEIAVELIRRIANEIVSHPQELKVQAEEVGLSWVIKIQGHRGDTPRLIGEKGNHVKAMDCVVAAIGNRYRMNLRLRLLEPEVGEKDRYKRFKAAEDWNKEGIVKLLQDVCANIFDEPVNITVTDEAANTSVIAVIASPKEKQSLVVPVGTALSILWNAIGKANGRIVSLDVGAEGAETTRDLGQIFG